MTELSARLRRLDQRVLGEASETSVGRGHWIVVAILYGALGVAGVIAVAAGVATGWMLIGTAGTGAVVQYVRYGQQGRQP